MYKVKYMVQHMVQFMVQYLFHYINMIIIIIIINNTVVEIWQTAKSKNHINFSNFWDQTCWTNSGFKNEKPSNSFWSRFSMKSLSGGVNLVVSSVNCLSKFDTSLWCFYKKNIHFKHDSKHSSEILISV